MPISLILFLTTPPSLFHTHTYHQLIQYPPYPPCSSFHIIHLPYPFSNSTIQPISLTVSPSLSFVIVMHEFIRNISPWAVPLIILYTHFCHGATHFDVLLFSLLRLMPFEPEPDKRPLSHGPSSDISSYSMLLGIRATAWYAICIDVNFRRWFGQNGDTLSFTIQGPHWCTICHSCGHSMQGLRESLEVGLVVRHRYSFLPRRRSHA